MADHSLPTLTSTYTNFLSNFKDRIDDSCKMFDPAVTSATNIPINTIRWNSSSSKYEKFNGTAWSDLATLYNINVATANNLNGGNNTTLLGSIPYQSNTNVTSFLAPNTAATRQFLRQLGTGTNGAIPVWDTIIASDVPTLNQNTTGSAAKLTTARNINGTAFDGTADINIEDRIGTAIASTATTTIGTSGLGDYIHITGTTTITSLGNATTAGTRRTLIFDGALTLTHNATSLICPGAASITTVAGLVIEVIAETTSNWRVVSVTHPTLSIAELSYLGGVTSNIQTQLNALANPISGKDINYKSTLVSITSWSYVGTTITLNVASHTFVAGDYIEVSGLTATTYPANGIQLVTSVTATTIVFTLGSTPTGTTGVSSATVKGFVTVNGRVSESIGVNQTWQNVFANRVSGVTYTNTTGKPILIAIAHTNNATPGNLSPDLVIGGVNILHQSFDGSTYGSNTSGSNTIVAIVPNNTTYVYKIKSTQTIVKWSELR